MSTEQASSGGTTPPGETLRADIKKAIELGADIQETVRNVTLKALTQGELDTASLRRVAGDVLKGAAEGATHRGAEAKESIQRAAAGLDEAFAKAAEAATLAAKEASGRMREFTSGDLRRAMDNLKGIESAFLDSLRDAAKSGRDVASTTLHAFAEHAANRGTAKLCYMRLHRDHCRAIYRHLFSSASVETPLEVQDAVVEADRHKPKRL